MKRLILGGVKSGKSRYAERLVASWASQSGNSNRAVIYLATAEQRDGDEELGKRIALHKAQRPPTWKTIEEPVKIADIIETVSGKSQCILVECLTLWVSNLLQDETHIAQGINHLCKVLETYEGEIILVSNETGLGIMPANELARRFGDEVGVLHQRLAAICDEVVLTIAGLPHHLKTKKRNYDLDG